MRIDLQRRSPAPIDDLDHAPELAGLLVHVKLIEDHRPRLPAFLAEQQGRQGLPLHDLGHRQADQVEDGGQHVDHRHGLAEALATGDATGPEHEQRDAGHRAPEHRVMIGQ